MNNSMRTVTMPRSHQTDALFFLKGMGLLEEVTICGSYGLKINGLLDRDIHDLDLITDHNWYNGNPFRGNPTENDSSHKFSVYGKEILCTKVFVAGCDIDLLYNPSGSKSEMVRLLVDITDNCSENDLHDPSPRELIVRVEDPKVAIRFKQEYMKNDRSEESREKHRMDLESLGVQVKNENKDTEDDLPW